MLNVANLRSTRPTAVVLVAFLLTACAQLGLAPASGLTDRIAYAYGTHTAVLESATAALEAGDIGIEDAQRALKVADQARQGLDAAKVAASVGDVSTAESRLQLAVSLLTELQNYLRSHQ